MSRSDTPTKSASLVLGLGLGLTLGIFVKTTTRADWLWPYPIIISVSRIAAMVGTYLALVGLVMVSRISWIEKAVGHDRLIFWHRRLGPYSLFLIGFHVLLVSLGYAGNDGSRVGGELWKFTWTYDWMLPATVGFIFFLAAGLSSYKKVRKKMSYETWWTVHLYTYLAIALSFTHQIRTGPMFLTHPVYRYYWIGLYILAAVIVLYWRFVIPVFRFFRYELRISSIVDEGANMVSVIMRGHNLDRMNALGGQFFTWRFLTPGHIWVSHPYSLSATPTSSEFRITVKNLGDGSGSVKDLKPGTRVFFEGPYGIFTAQKVTRGLGHVVLIGGGVGLAPLLSLIDDFDDSVDIDLLLRVSSESEIVHNRELDALAMRPGSKVHFLVGPRQLHPMTAKDIMRYVPAFRYCDVYVCGPTPLVEAVRQAADAAGVPKNRFHNEIFEFHAN
ncbi:MAG: ferredoxin reductase family protein [Actinomycetes bacterium]